MSHPILMSLVADYAVKIFHFVLLSIVVLVGFVFVNLLVPSLMGLLAELLEKIFKINIEKKFLHWLFFVFVLWCIAYFIFSLIKFVFQG